jgi:hypothetical protein
MATPLLADAHGQHLPRLVQHDLESFFWTTLFGLVNLSGPFQQVKDWSTVEAGSTSDQNRSFNTTIIPPAWMRPGLAEYTFHDVHASRLSTLGNWGYYRGFIQPYWEDQAILSGMEKMFNIFMSQDMLTGQRVGCIATDMSFNQDLRHDKLITIVKEIIQGIEGKSDILHMASSKLPLDDLVKKGRDRYKSVLRSRQLPPVVPDDLKNKPINSTIPTVPTVSKRHRGFGVDLPSLVDGSASTTPPVLQDGQCSYSTSHGGSEFYSSAHGDNTMWQGMGTRAFKKLSGIKSIKPPGTLLSADPHATTHYNTFTVSGSGGSSYDLTTPAVGDATPGGVSSTPAVGDASPGGVSRSSSKRSSADRRQAEGEGEGEGEGMLPAKKRHRGKAARKRRNGKGKAISGSRMGESGGHDDGDNPSAHAPGRGRPISPKAGSSR